MSPSFAALRNTLTAAPGSWCRIASIFGSTSLAQNSSAVRAIARCSSVRSSTRENVARGAVFNEKRAAFDLGEHCSGCCHRSNLLCRPFSPMRSSAVSSFERTSSGIRIAF